MKAKKVNEGLKPKNKRAIDKQINENIEDFFVPKNNSKIEDDIKKAWEEAGLNYDVICENNMTVEKLIKILSKFPKNLIVGTVNNNDIIKDIDLKISSGKYEYSGFDGFYSYNRISEKVPILKFKN